MKLRGICPVCGVERFLTAAGVMRHHLTPPDRSRRQRIRPECDGVGQPPRAFVEDPIVAAEARGYARAIADLRAEAPLICGSLNRAGFLSAADYLEAAKEKP